MPRPKILVVVLAGGAGGRLELLTKSRAKPAVPFGGAYRLIDFPLSNCQHSRIPDVWVIQQYNPVSLADHLANGRPWDLDRTYGGLLNLHPHRGEGAEGWHQGTADALWRNAPLIRQHAPDALVVVSADAVYTLDYSVVVDEHLDSDADVTMVTTKVDRADAARYGVVKVASDGRITDYAYKPEQPASDLVTNEVFVFAPDRLLGLLDDEAQRAGEDGLEDLGHSVLPRLAEGGTARQHRLPGYWRDVGTVQAYWSAHMDLLLPKPPLDVDDPAWPIHTVSGQRGPARFGATAAVERSLVSSGARVAGTVQCSVLGRGVVIEEGATVRDSVILDDTVISAGAVVERAIIDSDCRIGRNATVGGPATADADNDGLTLVGMGETVRGGVCLEPGARRPAEE